MFAKKRNVAILISPAPVDGYPPVQYQARILAELGLRVILITSTLGIERSAIKFQHTGVSVKGVQSGSAWIDTVRRFITFTLLIMISRFRNRGKVLVEICFEPVGIFLSDICPFRPRTRVAHFHETLMRMDSWYPERRLRFALKHFQKVVVADVERARILQRQTRLFEMPCVVPNYPKLGPAVKDCRKTRRGFEVIYAGSLGFDQKLDVVIRSVRLWPEETWLTLVGNDERPIALQLKTLAKEMGVAERVKFEGWLDLEFLECRLRQAQLGISLLYSIKDQWTFSVGASNKRYQYMQAGLPQIGDTNQGVVELLEGQKIGRCVRAYSEQEIANLVSYYAVNDAVRTDEGRRAEMLYRKSLNYDVAFAGVLAWILRQADCSGR